MYQEETNEYNLRDTCTLMVMKCVNTNRNDEQHEPVRGRSVLQQPWTRNDFGKDGDMSQMFAETPFWEALKR